MPSLQKNIIYSSILTCANYVFPLITFPYVSRVLGVTNIGICNFVDSVINYFILFAMMGIGIIGVREIASCGEDREKRDRIFSCLFFLNGLTTGIALVILTLAIFLVPQLWQYHTLMFIGAAKLLFSAFTIEWFFRGIENFKYITNRTIIVKSIYVASIFIFVRYKEDYVVYYIITAAFITIINALINFKYSTRFVSLRVHGIKVFSYAKPFFILGTYALLTSMYTSFNTTFLGFEGGVTEVGYYTTATKLFTIVLSLYSAFTGVMMPRMSTLITDGKIDEFKQKLNTSNELLLAFSIPIIMFGMIYAPEIVWLIAGNGYEGAITPMRIIMPLVFVIGYEQILVIQTLMPLRKDRAILTNSIIGACIGVLLNIIIVPRLGGIGSATVWLSSELVVLVCAQYFVTRYISFNFPFARFVRYTIISLLPCLVCLLQKEMYPSIVTDGIAILVSGCYYVLVYLFIIKIPTLRKIVKLDK